MSGTVQWTKPQHIWVMVHLTKTMNKGCQAWIFVGWRKKRIKWAISVLGLSKSDRQHNDEFPDMWSFFFFRDGEEISIKDNRLVFGVLKKTLFHLFSKHVWLRLTAFAGLVENVHQDL